MWVQTKKLPTAVSGIAHSRECNLSSFNPASSGRHDKVELSTHDVPGVVWGIGNFTRLAEVHLLGIDCLGEARGDDFFVSSLDRL